MLLHAATFQWPRFARRRADRHSNGKFKQAVRVHAWDGASRGKSYTSCRVPGRPPEAGLRDSRVMQRAAAEWREAGAEDRPGIHEVGIGHDVFGER